MDEGLGWADDGLDGPAVVFDDTVEALDCTVVVPGDMVVRASNHTVVVSDGTVEEQDHIKVVRDLPAAAVAQLAATGEGQVAPSFPLGPAEQQ